MASHKKPATWLDLAAGPRWDREHFDLKLHPVSADCGECFVLSLSGRMVYSGDGRLTVFRTRDAVARFLRLLEIEVPPTAEHCGSLESQPGRQQCLRLCGEGLCPCSLERDPEYSPAAADGARYARSRRSSRLNRSAIA
ncbi:MAG: hypothetical protein KDH17_05225 [Rhodocyclaceae bacterium]|nr:hypothetical protein [Rhodocyclaceae bacterium]